MGKLIVKTSEGFLGCGKELVDDADFAYRFETMETALSFARRLDVRGLVMVIQAHGMEQERNIAVFEKN